MIRLSSLVICLSYCLFSVVYSSSYKVTESDTLWSISQKFDCTVSVIKKINDLTGQMIKKDQLLTIPDDVISYTVKSGDNLTKIAENNSSEISYIILLNNLADEKLYVGQALSIPVFTDDGDDLSELEMIEHVVVSGDTLSHIAVKYGATASDIMKWNDKTGEKLYLGETLLIYVDPAQYYEQYEYTVKSGDTLSEIAEWFNVNSEDIITWNSKIDQGIYVGETLTLYIDPDYTPDLSETDEENVELNEVNYTVKSGDNLSNIAKSFGVSIDDILTWNKKQNEKLFVDEKLVFYLNDEQYDDYVNSFCNSSGSMINYKVDMGDSLSMIAWKYGIDQDDILRWNNKSNDMIFIGENLKLYIEIEPDENDYITYEVKSGDNLSKLSRLFDVSVEDIKSWNSKSIDSLYVGEKLIIYSDYEEEEDQSDKIPVYYTVKSGDSISTIAYAYGVGSDEIKDWNDLDRDVIYIGESLTVFLDYSYFLNGGNSQKIWKDFSSFPVEKSIIDGISTSGRGILLQLENASTVKSIQDGYVEYSGKMDGYNYVVIIRYDNNKRIIYGYLDKVYVDDGDWVTKDQSIGNVDYFSFYENIQLYMELREGKDLVDALEVLPLWSDLEFLVKK